MTATAAPAGAELRHIAIRNLEISETNMRRAPAGPGEIQAFVASMRKRGTLNSICVRPNGTGETFVVEDGGQRLRAARALAADPDAPEWTEDSTLPCLVRTGDADTPLESLMANIVRCPPNPVDCFEAFDSLVRTHGMDEGDIAAAFGTTERHVRATLGLARVAPELREAAREGRMGTSLLLAFAVTDDHDEQLRLWQAGGAGLRPDAVRQRLAGQPAPADGPLARYVGTDVYQARGGKVIPDLFAYGQDGRIAASAMLADTALLASLAGEKLQARAAALRADGWQWVETAASDGEAMVLRNRLGKRRDTEDRAAQGALLYIGHDGSEQLETGYELAAERAGAAAAGVRKAALQVQSERPSRDAAAQPRSQAAGRRILAAARTAIMARTVAALDPDAALQHLLRTLYTGDLLAAANAALGTGERRRITRAIRNTEPDRADLVAAAQAVAKAATALTRDDPAGQAAFGRRFKVDWRRAWRPTAEWFRTFTVAELANLTGQVAGEESARHMRSVRDRGTRARILEELCSGTVTAARKAGWPAADAKLAARAFAKWGPDEIDPGHAPAD